MNASAVKLGEPVYPEIARRMHLAGKVEVEFTIAPDDPVKNAKLVSGNSMPGTAAIAAVKGYKYEPGSESVSRIPFDFH